MVCSESKEAVCKQPRQEQFHIWTAANPIPSVTEPQNHGTFRAGMDPQGLQSLASDPAQDSPGIPPCAQELCPNTP